MRHFGRAAALARTGARARISAIGLTEVPACGTNAEVLAYHGLDGASIARTVLGASRAISQVLKQ